MKVQQLPGAKHLRPQKLSGKDTPHAIIEANTTCNIRCKFCYVIEHPIVKPLAQVKREIDLACERRRLDTISVLGGEPTLYDELPEVVRYIKSKGLICQVLTNGVRFLYKGDEALIDTLVHAGVDRFLVHVDSGQRHVHGDLDVARHRLFDMMDARDVYCGLSLTLYPGEEADLPGILLRFAPHKSFDGVLVTLARDFSRLERPPDPGEPATDMAVVASALHDQLGLRPSAYLPSNLSDDDVCWLMYFYWLHPGSGRAFGLSPELNRAMKLVHRVTRRHEFFGETLAASKRVPAVVATGAAELLIHPGRAAAFRALVAEGLTADDLRLHYVVVQQAPQVEAETGALRFCWKCPDAVVRNGVLTPVCMASRINPLGQRTPTASPEIRRAVFEHLGELVPPLPPEGDG